VLLRQVWRHKPNKEGVMRPGASRNWEDKSFFDQNKNKINFQRRSIKKITIIPPTTTTIFNYYTRQLKSQ